VISRFRRCCSTLEVPASYLSRRLIRPGAVARGSNDTPDERVFHASGASRVRSTTLCRASRPKLQSGDVALEAGHREAAASLTDHGAARGPLLAHRLGGPEALASYGDINERFEPWGRTILHPAVEARDDDVLRTALDLGADPALRDRQFGGTPLE
jgi:hypothetical protein